MDEPPSLPQDEKDLVECLRVHFGDACMPQNIGSLFAKTKHRVIEHFDRYLSGKIVDSGPLSSAQRRRLKAIATLSYKHEHPPASGAAAAHSRTHSLWSRFTQEERAIIRENPNSFQAHTLLGLLR